MTTPDGKLYRLRDVKYHKLQTDIGGTPRRSLIPVLDTFDIDLTFKWVNNPLARKMSFNQEPIDRGKHWTWFKHRVEEGNWWILEEFNGYGDVVPIGQVRFDKRVGILGAFIGIGGIPTIPILLHEHYIVSIFIAEEFRGKSFASQLLRLGLARVESQQLKLPCVAYIKNVNTASIHLFRGMYFANSFNIKGRDYTTIDGDDYITLVRYWQ